MKLPRFSNGALLCLIVFMALAVRLAYYTGPIGSDDTWYYLGAYEIYDGSYEPTNNYWKTRYGMLLPIAASYEIFGTNEFAAALWPMLCSIGAVALCYFLGKQELDAKTGLLAGTLLAFYPLDVHYAGLILPDVPLSFLIAASVFAFLRAGRSEKHAPALYFVSGLLMAVAYSCRSMTVIVLPFLALYIALFEKKVRPAHLLFAAGFLALISVESLYYTLEGLGPLHNFRINASATIAVNASGESSTSQAYYPAAVFAEESRSVFGPYFFLFLPAMVFSAIKRERGALIFLAWAGIILGVLQFGYVSLFPPLPIIKVRKFLNFATVPLVMVSAHALMRLRARYRWAAVAALVAVSMYLIRGHSYLANSTPEAWGGNMRQVGEYLQTLPPKTIYADGRTSGMLRLVTNFEIEADRFIDLYDVSSPHELENCYVVINKFYAKFDQSNPYAEVPRFAATYPMGIPPTWKARDFWQSAVLDVP